MVGVLGFIVMNMFRVGINFWVWNGIYVVVMIRFRIWVEVKVRVRFIVMFRFSV